MPRLLPFDAFDGPPVRARWTAILTAAPEIGDRTGPTEGIDAPARAETARLEAADDTGR